MKPPAPLLLAALLLLGAAPSHAAVGSAETGDVTVDSRTVRPGVTVGPTLSRATGKSVQLTSKKARPVKGFAALANQGKRPAVLAARAKRGNRFFKVAYFAPGNDTAKLLSGGYRTGELADGGAKASIRVSVKPVKGKLAKKKGGRTVYLKKKLSLPVTVWSVSGPGSDAATIRARVK